MNKDKITYLSRNRRMAILRRLRKTNISKWWFKYTESQNYTDFEKKLLFGILQIETLARPWFHRPFEIVASMTTFFMMCISKKYSRNLTVGPLQIGIITSLLWTKSEITAINYIHRMLLLQSIVGSCEIFKTGINNFLNEFSYEPHRFYEELARYYNGNQKKAQENIKYQNALRYVTYIDNDTITKEINLHKNNRENIKIILPKILTIFDTNVINDDVDKIIQTRLKKIKPLVYEGEKLICVVILCDNDNKNIVFTKLYGDIKYSVPVIDTPRLSASTSKIALYSVFLEFENTSLDSIFEDCLTEINFNGDTFYPKNADQKFRGDVTLEYAFKNSINTIALKLIKKIGIKRFVYYLRKCGINYPLPNSELIGLGTFKLTGWELLGTFSPIINSGYFSYLNPNTIKNQTLKNYEERLLSPDTVVKMHTLLRSTALSGTAKYLSKWDMLNLIGKTGTSENNRDFWFVGAINDRLYGLVWIGREDESTIHGINNYSPSSSNLAVPLWSDFVGCILKART